jgi:hypothetical protein
MSPSRAAARRCYSRWHILTQDVANATPIDGADGDLRIVRVRQLAMLTHDIHQRIVSTLNVTLPKLPTDATVVQV